MYHHRYHSLEKMNIEIELMIVDKDTWAPLPIAHNLLTTSEGEIMPELLLNDVAFSNEMIEHHIEIRSAEFVNNLSQLHHRLHRGLQKFNDLLHRLNGTLLPSGMHPFLNPETQTQLWTEQEYEKFALYDKIFNTHRHGCANIQSTRLLLPFFNEEEFATLHNAIRLILPMLPALTAASPICDSQVQPTADTRLFFYGCFHEKYPAIGGDVIPEKIPGLNEYQFKILRPIAESLKGADPEGLLSPSWLNARGVVPRLEKHYLEIRLMDTQESVFASCAAAALLSETIRYLILDEETLANDSIPQETLLEIYHDTVRLGEESEIRHRDYLQLFNLHTGHLSALEFWQGMIERTRAAEQYPEHVPFFKLYSQEGTLSSRLIKKFNLKRGEKVAESKLKKICRELARCLQHNSLLEV